MYEYHTIRIGEETGNLVVVLKQLNQHFTESIKQNKATGQYVFIPDSCDLHRSYSGPVYDEFYHSNV